MLHPATGRMLNVEATDLDRVVQSFDLAHASLAGQSFAVSAVTAAMHRLRAVLNVCIWIAAFFAVGTYVQMVASVVVGAWPVPATRCPCTLLLLQVSGSDDVGSTLRHHAAAHLLHHQAQAARPDLRRPPRFVRPSTHNCWSHTRAHRALDSTCETCNGLLRHQTSSAAREWDANAACDSSRTRVHPVTPIRSVFYRRNTPGRCECTKWTTVGAFR